MKNKVRDKVLEALEALQEEGVVSVKFRNDGTVKVEMDSVYSVVNISDEPDEEDEDRYVAVETTSWRKAAKLSVNEFEFYGED